MAIQYTPIPVESLAWALRTEGKLPLYDVSDVAPAAGQPPRVPALGDGQFDLTQWLSLGGSLWPLPVYGFVEGGWRYRSSWYYGVGSEQDYGSGPVWRAQVGAELFEGALLVYATGAGGPHVSRRRRDPAICHRRTGNRVDRVARARARGDG